MVVFDPSYAKVRKNEGLRASKKALNLTIEFATPE